MSTSIRVVTDTTQAATLAELGAATFRETFGHLYRPQDLALFLEHKHSVDAYRELITQPTARVWMACDASGAAIGYATAKPCDLPLPTLPPRSGELQRLYVRAPFQGAGIGKALIEHAFAWLDDNFDATYLSVYQDNLGAQRLYRRYGFEIVHEYRFMVGNHADPEFIMGRGAC